MSYDRANQDPGAVNPMYTRQGYLFLQQKNKSMPFNVTVMGSTWNKHYCQYQAKSKTLTMIPYNQLNGKITTTETVRVTSCLCKSEDSAEKFRFVVHGEDSNQVREDLYCLQNCKNTLLNIFVCLFDLGFWDKVLRVVFANVKILLKKSGLLYIARTLIRYNGYQLFGIFLPQCHSN